MARGCVIKRGNRYAIKYYDPDGTQKWKTVSDSKKEAEKVLTELMRQIHRSEYRELVQIGFAEFAKKWLADYAQGAVKRSTLAGYQEIVRKHLVPFFGNMKLTQITLDVIQGYVSEKRKEGKLSPKTINNTLVPLKEMLKHAVLWNYLRENPAQYVEKPRIEREEMDFLSPQELRLFLDNVDRRYYPLFLTACLTGMRRGELLGLKWGDIDWASSTIFVRRSLWQGQLTTPKSKNSVRAIAMSPKLKEVLFAYQVEAPASSLDLVFCNEVGRPLDPSSLIKRQFLPALRRAGLRRVRFHDLRHSYAAMLIHQGENIKFIQAQLGHASIQTTLDRYGHLLPEVHNQAAERLDQTLLGENLSSKIVAIRSKYEKEDITPFGQNGL